MPCIWQWLKIGSRIWILDGSMLNLHEQFIALLIFHFWVSPIHPDPSQFLSSAKLWLSANGAAASGSARQKRGRARRFFHRRRKTSWA